LAYQLCRVFGSWQQANPLFAHFGPTRGRSGQPLATQRAAAPAATITTTTAAVTGDDASGSSSYSADASSADASSADASSADASSADASSADASSAVASSAVAAIAAAADYAAASAPTPTANDGFTTVSGKKNRRNSASKADPSAAQPSKRQTFDDDMTTSAKAAVTASPALSPTDPAAAVDEDVMLL